ATTATEPTRSPPRSRRGRLAGQHTADTIAQSARMGGCRRIRSSTATPSTSPTTRRRRASTWATTWWTTPPWETALRVEDVDAEENWPRVLTLWRANLLGASAKGNEYFLEHLSVRARVCARRDAARDPPDVGAVATRHPAASGSDGVAGLPVTSSTLLSDIVLTAATWYESTNCRAPTCTPSCMRSPGRRSAWEARSDFDAFSEIARRFSELAKTHLGTRHDLVATASATTHPGETAQRRSARCATGEPARSTPIRAGRCRDYRWSNGTTPRSPRRCPPRSTGGEGGPE
ncbi:molybdopterin-dependent oxidoreductase, partial [Rhodococcus hoagii]|nr:molybdopterin-dependent oxidoreductase [Prescottella equi]